MLRFVAISLALCVVLTVADEYKWKRYLQDGELDTGLRRLVRGLFDCQKDVNGKCNPYTKCCGSLDCYYADGYDPIEGGVCVECIERDKKCQRDVACCGGLQCDKASASSVDGRCAPVRAVGAECHADSQCPGKCEKTKWYHVNGKCT